MLLFFSLDSDLSLVTFLHGHRHQHLPRPPLLPLPSPTCPMHSSLLLEKKLHQQLYCLRGNLNLDFGLKGHDHVLLQSQDQRGRPMPGTTPLCIVFLEMSGGLSTHKNPSSPPLVLYCTLADVPGLCISLTESSGYESDTAPPKCFVSRTSKLTDLI